MTEDIMSRSYRKTPTWTTGTDKGAKRQANKAVRRREWGVAPNQKALFKRVFCSYNICDYKQIAPGTTQPHQLSWPCSERQFLEGVMK